MTQFLEKTCQPLGDKLTILTSFLLRRANDLLLQKQSRIHVWVAFPVQKGSGSTVTRWLTCRHGIPHTQLHIHQGTPSWQRRSGVAYDTPVTGLSTHHSVQSCCLELEPGDHALGRGVPSLLRMPSKTYWTRDFSLALCPQQEGYVGSGTEGWVDWVAPPCCLSQWPTGLLCAFYPQKSGPFRGRGLLLGDTIVFS